MDKKRLIAGKAAIAVAFSLAASLTFVGCEKETSVPAGADTAISQEQTAQSLSVGSITCTTSAESLHVTDASIDDLNGILPMLPALKTLYLEGIVPDNTELLDVSEQNPDLAIICSVSLGNKVVMTDQEALDLSENAVSFDELNRVLPLFKNLKEIDLNGTNFSDQEKMQIADSFPNATVLCSLPLAGQYFPTDYEEIDISRCNVTTEEIDRMLPYFHQLKKLDMSFCGISDEEMDELNQRHPEVSIVWTVVIGEVKARTDAVYFYPAESDYYPTNNEMKKLRYCTEMIAVDIGHTRASDCEFLWYMPHVKYLILADTSITDITPVGNLKELIYLELFSLNIKDYSPLLNCTKLQDLNIGTTHADPEPLSKMTWLHNLQWHRSTENPDTKEAVLKLPEQLPDTNVVLFPKKKARNIGGPWRYLPNYYVFRDIIGATYFNQDQIADYWGEEDAARIMACESGKSFCADTLAQIIRERIDNKEPIMGIKNVGSEKAEILYQTLLNSKP